MLGPCGDGKAGTMSTSHLRGGPPAHKYMFFVDTMKDGSWATGTKKQAAFGQLRSRCVCMKSPTGKPEPDVVCSCIKFRLAST